MTNETIIREVAEVQLAKDMAAAVRETFTYLVEVRSVDNGRIQVWVTERINRDRRMELMMFGIGYEQAWKLHQQMLKGRAI